MHAHLLGRQGDVPVEISEAWSVYWMFQNGELTPPTYEEQQTWPAWLVRDIRLVAEAHALAAESNAQARQSKREPEGMGAT